ncbi:MAG TPA: hypothetical protein VMW52_02600, partial [Phycisphaerae bacterium]|nr:hypothetical protein [Phycisphaerae bacterium]
IIRVHSPLAGALSGPDADPADLEALDQAIVDALVELRALHVAGWPAAETEDRKMLDKAVVDSGWRPGPVYEFLAATPGVVWMPSKGFGSGSGAAAVRYKHPVARKRGTKISPDGHSHLSWQGPPRRQYLLNFDADHWKQTAQQGFLLPLEKPGAITVFGDTPATHRRFEQHILAEKWTESYHPKKGYVGEFIASGPNHWLDALAEALAALSLVGFRTMIVEGLAAGVAPPKSLSLSAMQKQKGVG